MENLPRDGLNAVCRYIGMPMEQARNELATMVPLELPPSEVRQDAIARYGGQVFRGRPEVRRPEGFAERWAWTVGPGGICCCDHGAGSLIRCSLSPRF